MAASCPTGQKTLWEKEKLLVTSNFSFSHSVFNRLVLKIRKNWDLFGKVLSLILRERVSTKVISSVLGETYGNTPRDV